MYSPERVKMDTVIQRMDSHHCGSRRFRNLTIVDRIGTVALFYNIILKLVICIAVI